jgi:hypothetical protein
MLDSGGKRRDCLEDLGEKKGRQEALYIGGR